MATSARVAAAVYAPPVPSPHAIRRRLLAGVGFALVASALFAVALAEVGLLPPGFPLFELLAGRYAAQMLVIALVVVPRRGVGFARTPRPMLQILRGTTMIAMPVAYFLAFRRIGGVDAWAATWLAPLIGIVFGALIGEERLRPLPLLIAAAGTVGAIAAHAPDPTTSLLGIAEGVGSGIAFGAFLTLTRKLRSEPASTGLFWTAACVTLVSLPMLARAYQPLTLRSTAVVFGIGVVWLLVLLTIDEALRRAPLLVVAPFLLLEIVIVRLALRLPWTHVAAVGGVLTVLAAVVSFVWIWRADDAASLRSLGVES